MRLRIGPVQAGALEVYIFDPAHAEDAFPGDLMPNDGTARPKSYTFIVYGTGIERAWSLLHEAANSADDDGDVEYRDALTTLARRVSKGLT